MSNFKRKIIALTALAVAYYSADAQTVELNNVKYVLNTATHEASASFADATLTSATILPSVTFNDEVYTVSSLADRAFYNCTKLQSVTLPATIKSVGSFAFLGSSALSRVDIPSLSDWLGISFKDGYSNPLVYAHNLYVNGTFLETLELPEGLTTVPANAFTGASISSVKFPDSVTEIGPLAFYECSNLTDFSAGSGMTTIGAQAFDGCTALKTAILSPTVTTVGGYAFNDCSSLTSVSFGSSVTTVGSDAFAGCDALEAVEVSDIASWCKIDFANSGANPLTKAHVITKEGKTVTDLEIPAGVTAIKDATFSGCTEIANVTIGPDVKAICNNSFQNCPALTSVRFQGPTNSIGSYAFDGCSVLNECQLPADLTNIGEYAFCTTALKEVTIPDGVTALPDAVFSECENLSEVTLPADISSIGFGCFSYCTALKEIILPEGLKKLGKSAFYYCTNLETVKIGSQLTTISDYAFSHCPISNIYVSAIEPPTASENVFSTYAGKLHVPEGSESVYASNTTWGKFSSITGMAGVNAVDCNESIRINGNLVSFGDIRGKVAITRLDGRIVYQGQPNAINLTTGIYIVRYGSNVSKIVIR